MDKPRFGIIGHSGMLWLDSVICFLLLVFIIGFLTIKSATNSSLFLLFFLSLFFLNKSVKAIPNHQSAELIYLIISVLALPVLAIFFSQLGRQEWIIRSYDGPARILLALPVFLLFIHKSINFSALIGFATPAAIMAIAVSVLLHPEIVEREGGRFATPFVRPNAFGVYTTILWGFCLFQLTTLTKTTRIWKSYQLSGVLIGLYLIIGSGTRGSWLAIPFIVVIWLWLNQSWLKKYYLAAAGLSALFIILIILFPPNTHSHRFFSGFSEISHWVSQSNLETSTGYRLSIWKISWRLFLQQPVFGYGEKGFIPYLNMPWYDASASENAKAILACCGAHNEFLSNIVRSGVFGGLSFLGLFLTPSYIFFKYCRHLNPDVHTPARLGLVYMTGLIIGGISIEVLNMKYMSSFYGLTISGLIAQIIIQQQTSNHEH